MCRGGLAMVWSFRSLLFFVLFFFFKQKTAYEMRISDWSSDVCSSDLAFGCGATQREIACELIDREAGGARWRINAPTARLRAQRLPIGRATCRERVCQYV